MVKYKYDIKDINERMIMINEDTRKLISDVIMENTVYNIVSQSAYGETDLTVKPKIYFFLDKEKNDNNNTDIILGSKEDNNLVKSENKEEEKVQNDNNKEENKNNNETLSSKNAIKSKEKVVK